MENFIFCAVTFFHFIEKRFSLKTKTKIEF